MDYHVQLAKHITQVVVWKAIVSKIMRTINKSRIIGRGCQESAHVAVNHGPSRVFKS